VAFPWDESCRAFTDATSWLLRTVELVADRWDRPGLGEWDVRALVGHTSRALLTVETYLGQPAQTIEVDSPAGYFQATRLMAAGPAVAQRGRDAGAALGADPAATLAAIAARVLPLLDACSGAERVTTIVGGMRLADYLPTRTVELAVHGADLSVALGVPVQIPPTAAAQALRVVGALAVADGRAGTLLLAATGRTGLPPGFSVL
jgi:uncharacterized protein (TIGR03083 family)